MIDYNFGKLRGRIIEKYGSVEAFSRVFGQTSTTVGRKLSGKSEWTQREIAKVRDLLAFPAAEIADYFFCEKS